MRWRSIFPLPHFSYAYQTSHGGRRLGWDAGHFDLCFRYKIRRFKRLFSEFSFQSLTFLVFTDFIRAE